MKEKKLSSLVLNKKVISRLNQSTIGGGDGLQPDLGIDDGATGFIICTNPPGSRVWSCHCGTKTYPGPPPVTVGCNTTTDMPSRSCA